MITASVVTYNTKNEDIDRLLECIRNSSIDHLYVIDHSPTDVLASRLQESEKLEYIRHENLGYGSGHNIGIQHARLAGSTYHVVLNPDIYWEGDIIAMLRDYMNDNEDCGLVMPKVLYPDGSIQYLCKLLPTPFDLFGRRFLEKIPFQKKRDGLYELRNADYNAEMYVPSLSGCFMFMRMSVLDETGGFDERYFMYCEDLDLCRRIGDVSKTMYYPSVSMVHEYGKGSYHNRKLLFMHIKSVVKYFNKWGWIFDKTRRERNARCLSLLRDIQLKATKNRGAMSRECDN